MNNNKQELELDLLNRKLSNKSYIIDNIKNDKTLIVKEIYCLKHEISNLELKFEESTLKKKIEEIEYFNKNIKLCYKEFYLEMKLKFSKFIKDFKEYGNVRNNYVNCIQKYINKEILGIKSELQNLNKNIIDIEKVISEYNLESIRKYYANIINQQRLEYEIEKKNYENKISELLHKRSSSDDTNVWDVFK